MKSVVGFGITGQSLVRFFERMQESYRLIASKTDPVSANEFSYMDRCDYFPVRRDYVQGCDELLLSPGLNPHNLANELSENSLDKFTNDIELFYRYATAPIIAVTGTNGKSTVATMLYQMINASGKIALLGGNIGLPALDLLQHPVPDYYVLELSSYQIELLKDFQCELALLLNIEPDHIERHGSFDVYADIKRSLLARASHAIQLSPEDNVVTISTVRGRYSLVADNDDYAIMCDGQCVIKTKTMYVSAKHDVINALFAIAACDLLQLDRTQMLDALSEFSGLEHRCEPVQTTDGALWINDSKATNIAATKAALTSFSEVVSGKVYLILGGVPKTDDYHDLNAVVQKGAVSILVYGGAVDLVKQCFPKKAKAYRSLEDIIDELKLQVKPGDLVLFAPGGASFDCYQNFEHRGNSFKRLVKD